MTTLRAAAQRVLKEFRDLAAESDGVAGLHKNGDIADWEWLQEDGCWLGSLAALRAALAAETAQPWGTSDGPCPRCGHKERHYWSVPDAVCDGCGGQCRGPDDAHEPTDVPRIAADIEAEVRAAAESIFAKARAEAREAGRREGTQAARDTVHQITCGCECSEVCRALRSLPSPTPTPEDPNR